ATHRRNTGCPNRRSCFSTLVVLSADTHHRNRLLVVSTQNKPFFEPLQAYWDLAKKAHAFKIRLRFRKCRRSGYAVIGFTTVLIRLGVRLFGGLGFTRRRRRQPTGNLPEQGLNIGIDTLFESHRGDSSSTNQHTRRERLVGPKRSHTE